MLPDGHGPILVGEMATSAHVLKLSAPFLEFEVEPPLCDRFVLRPQRNLFVLTRKLISQIRGDVDPGVTCSAITADKVP